VEPIGTPCTERQLAGLIRAVCSFEQGYRAALCATGNPPWVSVKR
jgi:hypothetical protein